MLFSPFNDTVPVNTMSPVDAIINPLNVSVDSLLLTPDSGTRYLLVDSIGSTDNDVGASAWRGSDNQDLIANAGDIVEYNGTHWVVSFDSQTETALQYVTNLKTGIQYKWLDNQWIKSFDGAYRGGEWSLAI
jgi:hypothetical protein